MLLCLKKYYIYNFFFFSSQEPPSPINLSPPPHTHTHTHTQTQTQTQTIKPSTEPYTHHQTSWSQQRPPHPPPKPPISKLTPPIWNPGRRKYPEKLRCSTQKNVENTQKYPSHWSETHTTDLKPRLSKIPSKTKTKPKLKQRHWSKPIIKKSTSKPPTELPMINPTDPPTDQQIHRFKCTDQPIQTHHQSIPAHRSKPSLSIHANPTSKIQNPTLVQALNERDMRKGVRREELWLVRDRKRKWESEWERIIKRIKYCFWFYNCAIVQF